MFSVVFEVYPKREAFDRYLDLAKELRPILKRIGAGRPRDVDMGIDRQQAAVQGEGVGGYGIVHDRARSQISA